MKPLIAVKKAQQTAKKEQGKDRIEDLLFHYRMLEHNLETLEGNRKEFDRIKEALDSGDKEEVMFLLRNSNFVYSLLQVYGFCPNEDYSLVLKVLEEKILAEAKAIGYKGKFGHVKSVFSNMVNWRKEEYLHEKAQIMDELECHTYHRKGMYLQKMGIDWYLSIGNIWEYKGFKALQRWKKSVRELVGML